jgi:hypothetical protein
VNAAAFSAQRQGRGGPPDAASRDDDFFLFGHYWSPQLTKTIAQIIWFFNPIRDGFLMDEVGAPRTRKA